MKEVVTYSLVPLPFLPASSPPPVWPAPPASSSPQVRGTSQLSPRGPVGSTYGTQYHQYTSLLPPRVSGAPPSPPPHLNTEQALRLLLGEEGGLDQLLVQLELTDDLPDPHILLFDASNLCLLQTKHLLKLLVEGLLDAVDAVLQWTISSVLAIIAQY